MRILFIEDELELNDLATGQLRRQGHEVVSVTSVSEAQSVIDGDGPAIECVITDHRLPDGFGVAFCLHCRVHHPRLVVGVVSGCLKTRDLSLLREYSVPYWVKPVLYSQVATELERSLPAKTVGPSLEERMKKAPVLSDRDTGVKRGLLGRLFRS